MEAKSKTFKLQSRVIQISGEVDMNSAPRLREKLRKTFDMKPNAVIVKLTEVTYMDSAGVAVLVEALQWAKKEKILLILAEPSKAARGVIQMARLEKFFMISENVETALPESKD